jgi:hypothetical protein
MHQRRTTLVQIGVSIVDRSDPADDALLVVQNAIGDVPIDAKLRHPRCAAGHIPHEDEVHVAEIAASQSCPSWSRACPALCAFCGTRREHFVPWL